MPEMRRRVLIVEDEMVIAMHLEDMLAELGHEVVGLASRLEAAMRLARDGDMDLAVLDINLAGLTSFPAADILRSRSIPYFFTSGYGHMDLAGRPGSERILTKPFQTQDLARAINEAVVS